MNSEGYNVTDENPVSFQQLMKAHTFYHPNKVNIAVSSILIISLNNLIIPIE
jgi:hypothetical protein